MRCYVYSNQAVIIGAKRASRLIRDNTMPLDTIQVSKGELLDIHLYLENIEKVQRISKTKKIYLLNREPLGHIKSGLVNIFEHAYKLIGPFTTDVKNLRESSEYGHTWKRLIYLSADESNFENNFKDAKLNQTISQNELLILLNWFIDLYNRKSKDFYLYFTGDTHTSPKQHLIKELKNSIDCEIVDIEEHTNLLKYLGFDWNDTSNIKKKMKYSQEQPKLFFSILLDYILTQDKNIVANHFKSIYGKNSVVRGSTLSNIIKNNDIINVINKEVQIYNELKQYSIS